MTRIDQAVASPEPVRWRDKDWLVSPLDMDDFGKITQRVRQRVISLGRDAASEDGTNPKIQEMLIDRAYREVAKVDFLKGGAEAQSHLSDPGLLIYILYLSLRHNHEKLIESEVAHWFTLHDIVVLERFTTQVLNLSGMGATIVEDDGKASSGEEEASESKPDSDAEFQHSEPVYGSGQAS